MYHKTVLPNGVRLLSIPMRDTKTVTVLVFVGTGSKYETKRINGISHFLEHALFKGTDKWPTALALSETLDKVGAEFNAFTGGESTAYYVKADYTHLDLALEVTADMIFHAKLDEKEIEKEKGVIIEEINMYNDNPQRKIGELLEALMYGDQPAGWSIAGEKETIKAFTQKDFADYIETHYTFDNIVVAVAGNFTQKELEKKVELYFQPSLERGGKPEKPAVEERQTEPKSLVHYKKTDQTHFYLAFRSRINALSERRFAQSLLASILGGNMSSRLFTAIREQRGLAYYIHAGTDMTTDTGYLYANAGVDNACVHDAIRATLAEFAKIRKDGVTDAELEKAKNYFQGKTYIDLESSDALAGFFGGQEITKGSVLTPEEMMGKVKSVTKEEVNAVARELFMPENLNLALIGPFENKEEFDELLHGDSLA